MAIWYDCTWLWLPLRKNIIASLYTHVSLGNNVTYIWLSLSSLCRKLKYYLYLVFSIIQYLSLYGTVIILRERGEKDDIVSRPTIDHSMIWNIQNSNVLKCN